MRRSRTCLALVLATLVTTVALTPWGSSPATAGDTTGTGAWRLQQPALAGEIEGYADRVSGEPGAPVQLSVSTVDPWYTVTAYRFGDYTGGPAHVVWTSSQLAGVQQPPPTLTPYATRTVTANWPTSVKVPTAGWAPGVYLFKLEGASGYQAHIPYIVRSSSTSGTVAIVLPVATWQAYNNWGGYSLYDGPDGDRHSWAVSCDRPYASPGTAHMRYDVIPAVLLAERMNIPVSYLANTDLALDPGVLQGARAYVSLGHDEYWSREMRDAVVAARDTGTNLAFLGANTMYWRVRLESSARDVPGRVVVGYKWDARNNDPLYASDPELATTRWRDAPSPEPENAVTGMQYECYPVDTAYRVVSPRWWGFRQTAVAKGTRFPHLVGNEADRVYPIDTTPRPLQVLSYSKYSCRGAGTSSQSTYYTTPSGAAVFNAGTLRWVCAIYDPCGSAQLTKETNHFVRHVTRNLLHPYAKGPAGLTHPAHDNVANFALPTVNEVPAS